MKLATTTLDFYPYCNSICQSMTYVSDAGFRYIDLSFDGIENMEEQLFGENWKADVEKIKKHADKLGVSFVQSHAISGCNVYYPGAQREQILQKVKRCIEVCAELGIPNTVLHEQIFRDFDINGFFEANKNFIEELYPVMEKYGINVLIENGPKKHFLETYYTDEPIENPKYLCGFVNGQIMKDFIEYVNHPLVHACWDTGHANMDGMQYGDILILGKELHALHVHDNNGEWDYHTLPYLGTMNLDDLMNALIDSGYNGYFTFEAVNVLKQPNYWLGMRRKFEKDNRLASPKLFMQADVEKLMYHIGKHILESYGCFEN